MIQMMASKEQGVRSKKQETRGEEIWNQGRSTNVDMMKTVPSSVPFVCPVSMHFGRAIAYGLSTSAPLAELLLVSPQHAPIDCLNVIDA
jgi:hypothetical protein